ncbi:hemolysin D [Vibrio fortis]|uniref:Hemolysin D n=1 Tax=Vibrio fortis TaxID=212667 RepID=A0A066UNJ4_9VIBR|nr:HlyD family secretion protein [Vibrio fortis]KDN27467.1 hemolysin D [Vibrio fortis]
MLKRNIMTLLFVLGAAVVSYQYYSTYTQSPWTRDGQVQSYVISITPRVTGQVTSVHVHDNADVKQGDLLFEIDDSLYKVAYDKAIAEEQQAKASLERALNEEQRAVSLESRSPGSVPVLTINNLDNAIEAAQANLELAQATVKEALLNLEYTKVYAPEDGYITNLNLRVGSHVVANSPVVALIDKNSFWIEAYFKETDLKGVNVDNEAQIVLMTHDDIVIEGTVQSIGFGIAKQDGSTGVDLLPNVNPNFQWIRLAQRIPVKIQLDDMPEYIQLRVGMTASVKIYKQN